MGNSYAVMAAVLPLLLLAGMPHSDFSMKSLSVFVNINLDGSANIDEQLEMVINGNSSRELYETTRAAYSDLTTWKTLTGLPEMRHHVTRAKTDVADLRIIPQAIERCNSFLGTCYATVAIDYKIPATQNGSGLIQVDRYKPRTLRYSLQQDALSFEQTETGDLILPTGTVISIAIPQNSEKIFFSTVPTNLAGDPDEDFKYDSTSNMRYYIGQKRIFKWSGNALSKFQFTYEVELPLETEVVDFFVGSQNAVSDLIFGPQGLAALFIILTAAASFYYMNRINSQG
ncbi:MAG: hypothetical protein NTX79_08545 [Candidatus Micrarchaeota archaeon]|nr:hypothetical protein [Candidatus Micrarchaeota archaeon]